MSIMFVYLKIIKNKNKNYSQVKSYLIIYLFFTDINAIFFLFPEITK